MGGSGEPSTDSGGVLPSSIHLFRKQEPRTQQRPDTHPSHVTDAEYPVDGVFIDVCRDELHLDGPVAPRRLLRPVLHAELRQGEGLGRGVGFTYPRACGTHWLKGRVLCRKSGSAFPLGNSSHFLVAGGRFEKSEL